MLSVTMRLLKQFQPFKTLKFMATVSSKLMSLKKQLLPTKKLTKKETIIKELSEI